MTISNTFILIGGGSLISFIMSKIKPFKIYQQQENNEQNLDGVNLQQVSAKEGDEQIEQKKSDSVPIPVGQSTITQGQNQFAEGEIIEQGNMRGHRFRNSKLRNLPINQIQIDIQKIDKKIIADAKDFLGNQQDMNANKSYQNVEKINNLNNINSNNLQEEMFASQDYVIRENGQTIKINDICMSKDAEINTDTRLKFKSSRRSINSSSVNFKQESMINQDININQHRDKSEKTSENNKQEVSNLPQGIPLNDAEKQMNQRNKSSIDIEMICSIYNYHPLKSFSQQLQYVPVSVRVVTLFCSLAVLEWLCIANYFKKSVFISDYSEQEIPQETQPIIRTILQTISLKISLQYIFPFIYYTFSFLEKYILGQSLIFNSQCFKSLLITILSAFAIFQINFISKFMTHSQASIFIGVFFATAALDLIVLDFIFLYALSYFNKCYCLFKLLRLKNYDYTTS